MAAPFSLAADFSPEIAAFLVSASGRQQLASLVRGRDESLRDKLRKHLVAMGWSIATKYNSVMAPRLRYHSPPDDDAKTTYYDSLPHLVLHYYGQDQKAEHGQDVDLHEKKAMRIFEEEEEKDVIDEYIALMAAQPRARGSRAERLRVDVKRQLESAGWSFWMKLKSDGREELRYKSPINGRSYMSLHAACLAFVSQSESTKDNKKKRKATPTHVDVFKKSSTIIKRKKGTLIKKCTTTTTKRRNIRTISELLHDGDDDGTCCISMIKKKRSSTTTTTTSKRKKPKLNDDFHHKHQTTRLLRPRGEDKHNGDEKHRSSRTLLSVLIDKKILMRRDMKKVTCRRAVRDSPPLKRGVITGDGLIRCECCNKAFTVTEFDAHSSSSTSGPGWGRNMFLEDGRSLAQCLVQLRKKSVVGNSSMGMGVHVRVKSKCTDLEGDSVCSICHGGGELLLCDHCPSTFHHDCLGLPCIPAEDDDWSCPSCRCVICDRSDFDPDIGFTDKTIVYCDQCERECHVGCLQGGGGERQGEEGQVPWSSWLCSDECSKVFHHLQRLVGAPAVATEMEGVSLVVLRSTTEKDEDSEAKAEQHGKLCAALDVLHECFVPLIEPRTQSDLVADVLFNRESDLRRLHFRGYYAVGLEKGGELVTVGTLRVYGNKVAELPLVGTRFAHRRQGMCRLLLKEVERMLVTLGVHRLVLPSVPELLRTWTGPSFGFKPMTHSDKLDMAEHTILCFQGTTMCQKFLQPPCLDS